MSDEKQTKKTRKQREDLKAVADKNELDVLLLVERFGWLRAHEIGLAFNTKAKTPRTGKVRVITRLLNKNELLRRPLPGTREADCFTVAGAGRRRLISEGYKIGRKQDVIPGGWRHDLIAAQVLISSGKNFLTERECRRFSGQKPKVPDGLVQNLDGTWKWLEVERVLKKRESYELLLKWCLAAERGFGWCGLPITGALLVCPQIRGESHYERFARHASLMVSEEVKISVILGKAERCGTWHTDKQGMLRIVPNLHAQVLKGYRVAEEKTAEVTGFVRWKGKEYPFIAVEDEEGTGLWFSHWEDDKAGEKLLVFNPNETTVKDVMVEDFLERIRKRSDTL